MAMHHAGDHVDSVNNYNFDSIHAVVKKEISQYRYKMSSLEKYDSFISGSFQNQCTTLKIGAQRRRQ